MTPQFYTITAKQISTLQDTSYKVARKELQRVKDIHGLNSNQPLMLRHLAIAWDVSVDELAKALHIKYK